MENCNVIDVPIEELQVQMDVDIQNEYGNVIDVPIEELQVHLHDIESNDDTQKINKIMESVNARKMKCHAEFIPYDNGKCFLLLFLFISHRFRACFEHIAYVTIFDFIWPVLFCIFATQTNCWIVCALYQFFVCACVQVNVNSARCILIRSILYEIHTSYRK